jgi:hypothetical protein
MHLVCPHCHHPIELVAVTDAEVVCPSCESSVQVVAPATTLGTDHADGARQIGRFTVLQLLGQGAFGAEAARSATIAREALAIAAECQQAAGGDWDRWQRQTAAYREELRRRVEMVREIEGVLQQPPELREQLLEGMSGFPLVEVASREYLPYLYDSTWIEAFRRERAVVAADPGASLDDEAES